MTHKLKIALSFIVLNMTTSGYALAAGNWSERIKLDGDFRYRYEFIGKEGKEDRHRNRIRLRAGIHAKVNETVDVSAVLATGGEDPVSTNQSIDSQSTTKDIRLDQGYFAWKAIDGLTVKGGKFKNPFYKPVKSELLWDSDFRPEGLALQYKKDNLFFNGSFFYLEERSKSDDSFLLAGQFGYSTTLNGAKTTIGAGYFGYSNIKGLSLNDFDYLEKEADSFGNSLDDDGKFVNEYEELELFGDVTFKANSIPISLFFDYVLNTDAEANDTGYLVGFKVNKVKKPGSWDFRYTYREIESDAVFGVFTDSDFIGGGTDGTGHELNFGYKIGKGWKLLASYFMSEVGLDNGQDFDRVQVDFKFKF